MPKTRSRIAAIEAAAKRESNKRQLATFSKASTRSRSKTSRKRVKRKKNTTTPVHELEYDNLVVYAGMEHLPEEVNGVKEPDWESLFPVSTKPDEEYRIPPRMASVLYDEAIIIVDDVRLFSPRGGGCSGELPRILRKYFCGCSNKRHRIQLLACFDRIIQRLGKGIFPRANCVGEIVALQIITECAELSENFFSVNDNNIHLPTTKHDEDFDLLRKHLFDYNAIVALSIIFERNVDIDRYYYGISDEEEEGQQGDCFGDNDSHQTETTKESILRKLQHWQVSPQEVVATKKLPSRDRMIRSSKKQVAKHLPGLQADFAFEADVASKMLFNLHTGRWFVALSEADFTNHL